jgi:hypothetical protein
LTAPESRWRPIDAQGNVDPRPASEAPDDPSEGETGPPEQDLDLLLNAPHEVCLRCGRSTWDTTQFGQVDSMAQPDGGVCGGRFKQT